MFGVHLNKTDILILRENLPESVDRNTLISRPHGWLDGRQVSVQIIDKAYVERIKSQLPRK